MLKRQLPKAETPPLSLFFEGLRFGASNKETNNGESAINAVSLVWAHREQRRQDIGPWQMLSWRERPKPLEGRAAAAHVGCCVVVVFCVVARDRVLV